MNKLINDNKSHHFLLFKPRKSLQKSFIVTSAHSGDYLTKYLYDKVNKDKKAYLSMNDMFINDISILMKDIGVTILQSDISRIVIDLNRSVDEIDPFYISNPPRIKFNLSDKAKAGIGLIPTRNTNGKAIYESKLLWDDVEYRIENYYLPWHGKLRKEINSLHKEFGKVFVLDLHSMPSELGYKNDVKDFVIGNYFDRSSSKLSKKILSEIIESYGYKCSFNEPYSGGYITKNYFNKYKNIQCIQLEIRRDLYMNEENLEKKENFESFSSDLKNIVRKFSNAIEYSKEITHAAE